MADKKIVWLDREGQEHPSEALADERNEFLEELDAYHDALDKAKGEAAKFVREMSSWNERYHTSLSKLIVSWEIARQGLVDPREPELDLEAPA